MGGEGSGGPRPGAGRPRTPVGVKLTRGTLSPREALEAVGTRPSACPVPPPPEGLNERQAGWWRALATAVEAVRVFTIADLPAFVLMVEARTDLDEARCGIMTDTAADGTPVPVRPGTIVQLTRNCATLMGVFGLTPAARERLQPAPAPPTGERTEDPDDLTPVQ